MSDQPIIETAALTKHFGSVTALDGLDLSLAEGEVLGFLGPNGAGKSTTIRILLGLVRRSGGRAQLFGRDPWRHAVTLHRRLSYVPGDVALWPQLTGGQCIDLLGSSGAPLDRARRDELLQRFDLDPSKRIRDLSKGNRQKIALVAALAADADLLLLDEPSSGLDPLMEEVFRQCVRDRADAGVSVLLSSHILSEVDALCENVTIIRHGRVVQSGSVAELRRLSRTTVHAITHAPVVVPSDAAIADLTSSPVPDGGFELSFSIDPAALDRVLPAILAVGTSTLTVRPPSLDELFLDAYESAR